MKRSLIILASLSFVLAVPSAHAGTSFKGSYLCSLDSSAQIKDGQGNSVTIPDFSFKVNSLGRIDGQSKITSKISGKTKTSQVKVKGSIKETYPNSEATFSFTLTPSQRVNYKGKAISFKSQGVELYRSSSSAYGEGNLVTPFGVVSITCGTK